jgi:hypothetical protein
MSYKYYSLDECLNKEIIFEKLDFLQEERKIEYATVDIDVIRIVDTGLTPVEIKEILLLFHDNDIIEYLDYHNESLGYQEGDEDYDSDDDDDFGRDKGDYRYDQGDEDED